MILDFDEPRIGGLSDLEGFAVFSAAHRHACFLPVAVMLSACLPGDEQEDPVQEPITLVQTPVADADEVADGSEQPTLEPAPQAVELDMNDVSILLPPPTSADDPVLAITDLTFDGEPVWPDEVFAQFLSIANGDAGAVAAEDVVSGAGLSRIDVSAFADKAVWHVASIRIDPGAPGLSEDIAKTFGQQPQIRLVLQPVTDGEVHDVAAHVIYSFVDIQNSEPPLPGCIVPRLTSDRDRFRLIIDDLVAMKSSLAAGEIGDEVIDTDGPLGVHPATGASATTRTAFRNSLKGFLETHLDPSKINAMAIMGLPGGPDNPEPWIFLAMSPSRETGRFAPLPSPAIAQDEVRFAQMLDVRRGLRRPSVSPAARANNLNPITCAFEVPANPKGVAPPETPNGLSTAELFPDGDAARMQEIVSVIADPTRAHFFNTDCVSCHTETRREMDILGTKEVDAPVDPAVLPTELWNLRNFGWFPSFLNDGVFATATRRTATETEEVVEAINEELRQR